MKRKFDYTMGILLFGYAAYRFSDNGTLLALFIVAIAWVIRAAFAESKSREDESC